MNTERELKTVQCQCVGGVGGHRGSSGVIGGHWGSLGVGSPQGSLYTVASWSCCTVHISTGN